MVSVDISAAFIDAGDDGTPKYSGEDMRALVSLLFAPGPKPLTAAPGIITGLGVSVSGRQLTVAPGAAIATSTLGSFLFLAHTPARLAVSAANATYERVDLLVLRANVSGAGRGGKVEIIEGTPSARPTAPTAPLHSLVLGQLRVPTSGAISWSRVAAITSVAGGGVDVAGALTAGARSGTVTVKGDRVWVSVTASGSTAPIATLKTRGTGVGLLVDGAGAFWPARVNGNQVTVPGPPPAGTSLTGVITIHT